MHKYAYILFFPLFALRQSRVAESSTEEDITPGYALLHLRAGAELADWLQVHTGVENLLDKLYHHHLSIENLPVMGRNFCLRAKLEFN